MTPSDPNISSRGRPKGPPKDKWHISIDADVSLFFRMMFHDDFTGKTSTGAMSELANRLLRAEMQRLKGDQA